MAILSITFHTEEHKINDWNSFLEEELLEIIKNFSRKYIISEVESEMLSEGKNTNVLLFFDNQSDRIYFLENELPHISNKIFEEIKEFSKLNNKVEIVVPLDFLYSSLV